MPNKPACKTQTVKRRNKASPASEEANPLVAQHGATQRPHAADATPPKSRRDPRRGADQRHEARRRRKGARGNTAERLPRLAHLRRSPQQEFGRSSNAIHDDSHKTQCRPSTPRVQTPKCPGRPPTQRSHERRGHKLLRLRQQPYSQPTPRPHADQPRRKRQPPETARTRYVADRLRPHLRRVESGPAPWTS